MTKVVVDLAEVLSPEETSEELGKGIATIWRWSTAGKEPSTGLPFTKLTIGGRCFFLKNQVEAINEKMNSLVPQKT